MAAEMYGIAHTTEAEIKFIDGLGLWVKGFSIPRRELLRGYICGAKKRTDWGVMDGAAVIAHAEGCLGKLG